jgi:O-antigen chain-terminating methyltransferase
MTDRIDVDQLMQRVRDQVHENRIDSANLNPSAKIGQNRLILGQVRKLLNSAESRSAARTKWPDKLSQFPFSISLILKPLVLKTLSALFKDQREINQSLIGALRLSLSINELLLEELENLRKELETKE